MNERKKLSIIGGMGPMATAYFLELITQMTEASCDSEHMEIDVKCIPSIPDRTAYILGKSKESPVPRMIEAAKELEANGASLLAIPCNTAFYFYREIQQAVGIPILHPIVETTEYLHARGIRQVGILATDGTVQTELFQDALREAGMIPVMPNGHEQVGVMKMIYSDVKAGLDIEEEEFYSIAEPLFQRGAETIVLGCTELSMIKKGRIMRPGYLDTLEVLAKAAVEQCAVLKPAFLELITD